MPGNKRALYWIQLGCSIGVTRDLVALINKWLTSWFIVSLVVIEEIIKISVNTIDLPVSSI